MNNFAILLKIVLSKQFNIEVDVFFSRKKLHISFKKSLSSYHFFDELLKFVKKLWHHPFNNIEGYEMIFSKPTNKRNMFYYIFLQKKKCQIKP